MNKTFCDICETELGMYDQWSVEVSFSNDPKPPIGRRRAQTLCESCVGPALSVLRAVDIAEKRRSRQCAA